MTVYENVTRNVTTEVSYNATRNVTVSHNVTVVENVTSVVNVTNTTVSQQPVDVVVALDSSASVGDDGWLDENEAARTLLQGLRENLAGNMSAGMSVWAAAKAVRIELAAPPADGGDEIDLDEVDLRDVLLGAEADPPP